MELDLWGKALLDHYQGHQDFPLALHTSFDDPELMSMDVFFRDQSEFTELESLACSQCRGSVIDIGAGTGCHSLELQNRGFEVTALEKSRGACEVMRQSGVNHVIEGDIYHQEISGYDTALMMMNGLGLAGTLKNLPQLLTKVMSCLEPSGQIIADSSDIAYLYRDLPLPSRKYYGELEYYYEYQGLTDDIFPWLFVDYPRLQKAVDQVGLKVEFLFEEEDQYLVRIYKI